MSKITAALLVVATLLPLQACVEPTAPRAARAHSLAAADAALADSVSSCGAVTAAGCCAGDTLRYCAAGKVKTKVCAAYLRCGWSAAYGLYGCGTSAGADPSGKHPRACAGADAAVDALGDATPVPPGDQSPAQDKAVAPDAIGCGPLSFAGCCVKQKLYFCSGGKVLALDCQSNLHCGWNATGGYYDCGTDGKPDPAGKHPRSCSAVIGDAGLALDVGLVDLGADLSPGDTSAADAPSDDAEADIAADTGGTTDGPADDNSAGDAPAEGPPGLDPVGLEPSRPDASTGDADTEGCSCAAATGQGRWPGVMLLLGLLLLTRRRRGP